MFIRMNLDRVIDHIASQANGILADVKTRAEARVALIAWLQKFKPEVTGPATTNVIDGVMSVLEDEGFFGQRFTDGFDERGGDGLAGD